MGSRSRNANIAVKETLSKETFRFDFHQAVELIHQLNPQSIPVGVGSDPTKEPLSIKARVSLSPSSGEIHAFIPPSARGDKPILWVNFMGIAGIQGPLPTPYTELLLQRNRFNDFAFRDFLDIFNHRLTSIWHKLKKRTFISYSQQDPRKTHVGQSLMSISGLMNESYRDMIHVSERTLLSYHDLMWHRPKSAYGLLRVLQTHFQLNVNIEQFTGDWIQADIKDCTLIGRQFHALGTETILGNKVWDQAAGIRIDLGPSTWEKMNQLLPCKIKNKEGKFITGRDYQTLQDLIRFYMGHSHKVKIRYQIHPMNVKPLRLNRQFGLGYNSWITVGKRLQTPCVADIVLR